MQAYCNNSVYDDVCGINKASYKDERIAIVDPNDPAHLEVNIAGTPDDYYTMGEAVFNNDSRLITKQTGLNIYIHFPFRDLISGDTIAIYPGCDKSLSTCHNVFNNTLNFVGMPLVPDGANPIDWGVD